MYTSTPTSEDSVLPIPFFSQGKKNLIWNWAYRCAGASVLSEAAHAVLRGQNIQLACNVLAFFH